MRMLMLFFGQSLGLICLGLVVFAAFAMFIWWFFSSPDDPE